MTDIDVDFTVLESRLATAGFVEVRPLSGGASSLSFAATAQADSIARPVVVKMAPPGLAPVRNRDVLRQAAMLRLLADTSVPVPTVIWEDPGSPPAVPPIFVMSFVEGISFEPLFDGSGTDDPRVVAERMRNAARAMATLHAIVPDQLGLAQEPVASPGEELARWIRALRTVEASLVPGWEDVADALRATEPPAIALSIVHGDFRLGNVLANGATIAAVIDWEIWSIGDPRVDLGWFLANADPATYGRQTPYTGRLPPPDELAAVYRDELGRSTPDLDWFQALACFKSAATWSLIVKHARSGSTPDPVAEEVAGQLPRLLRRAASLIDGN